MIAARQSFRAVADILYHADQERRPKPEEPDDLAPARGLVLGIILGVLAWIALGLLVWWLT